MCFRGDFEGESDYPKFFSFKIHHSLTTLNFFINSIEINFLLFIIFLVQWIWIKSSLKVGFQKGLKNLIRGICTMYLVQSKSTIFCWAVVALFCINWLLTDVIIKKIKHKIKCKQQKNIFFWSILPCFWCFANSHLIFLKNYRVVYSIKKEINDFLSQLSLSWDIHFCCFDIKSLIFAILCLNNASCKLVNYQEMRTKIKSQHFLFLVRKLTS